MKRKAGRIAAATLAGVAGLCLVITLILFFISGGFMSQQYMEPWSKEYSAKFTDPRERLTAVGLLAASNHNMQPWKIQLDKSDPMVFYLYADSSRMTKEVDPDARQMMVTQGTFLEYVSVAGEKQGWQTEISLFPNGEYDESDLASSMDTKPVAKISLLKAQPVNSPLYDAIFLPDTNRNAYKPDPLTSAQTNALEALSTNNHGTIQLYQDKPALDKIGEYALQSATIEAGVARVMDESNAIFRPNEREKNKYRYGYSVEGQGTTGFMKHILQGLVTVFPSMNTGKAASDTFINSTKTSIDNTPAYAMIVTSGNSRTEQVESGMLYSKLVLTGHVQGLAMQPLSQVLEEYPEMAKLYTKFKEAYAPNGGTVQMLFRVGTPTKDVPLSMRRDVKDLITAK